MKPLKVLIVDDDPATCSLLQTIFEMENYQTASVSKIQDESFIALLEQEQPHILILDYHVGDKETLNYLPIIRGHPDWQTLTVLMISAVDRGQECLAAGANGFVLKPFDWQAIVAATHNALDQAHPNQNWAWFRNPES